MDKIKPSELDQQARELIKQGKMPSIQEVLKAVAASRDKFRDKIVEARNMTHPADTLQS